MPFNMMIGYDVDDRFTMEHFPLRQRVTLATKIYCWRLYLFQFKFGNFCPNSAKQATALYIHSSLWKTLLRE
jgi:hypothetical protein